MRILALFYIAMLSGVMASSPNILLIISDDQSWTDYSFMGHPDIKTPHIDKFAKELNICCALIKTTKIKLGRYTKK